MVRREDTSNLMSSRANRRVWTVAALVISALSAGGCATSIADIPLVGVPSDTPARPKEAGAYPAVHDLPADREQSAMEPSEQSKIEKELVAVRDRQAAIAAGQSPAPAGPVPAAAGKAPAAKAKSPAAAGKSPAAKSKAHLPTDANAAVMTGVAGRP
jgi:hypothetical protein